MLSKFQQSASKTLLGIAFLCAAPLALANNVDWSVTVGSPQPIYSPPVVYSAPQPVYVRPAPVYVQPSPVYVQPRPVYARPAPVVVQSGYVQYGAPVIVEERWHHRHHHGHGHGHGNGHWKHH
jgi:hypothetical protein